MKKGSQVCYSKIIIAALVLFSTTAATAQQQFKGLENLFTTPKSYVAGYTKNAPLIDGDINDAAWQQAKWSDDFVDIEGNLKPNPPLKTNIKMLWDDTCLYMAVKVMDPNVWATLKKRDDIIFMDNDVEVFIDPGNTTHEYFEIEWNAINSIFDLFLNKPYRNQGRPISSWDVKGMRSAVKIQGTLNDPSDTDKGWTVEIAIPFKALSLGNRRSAPGEGTFWRFNFSRVEWDTKVVNGKYEKLKDNNGRNLPEHNWVWSPQGVINMHFPERFGYLQFTKKDNAPAFVLPYSELQKQYLWLVYYRQTAWFREHGVYAQSLKELDVDDKVTINGNVSDLKLEATPHQFMALITDKKDNITWRINQEGLVGKLSNNPNE
ncbi:carbohydrate-binding family 9-like protein [Mucilaginibacter sp. OK098]|uniref:carbohydrate-binding family 9-like protein n=1 Tax=Mucilaginibacter sp. OK098 TaxID=1855297 RepID=UPI0009218BDE|nr:carbohydrate-binding family 9-like protein [Mucilaginibacter sp. OK098]SHN12891.1 Carbohydrate family 9 binding domain-like [Mucilaginibacter sp. OK098]